MYRPFVLGAICFGSASDRPSTITSDAFAILLGNVLQHIELMLLVTRTDKEQSMLDSALF